MAQQPVHKHQQSQAEPGELERPKWKTVLFWILRIVIALVLLKMVWNVIEVQAIHFS